MVQGFRKRGISKSPGRHRFPWKSQIGTAHIYALRRCSRPLNPPVIPIPVLPLSEAFHLPPIRRQQCSKGRNRSSHRPGAPFYRNKDRGVRRGPSRLSKESIPIEENRRCTLEYKEGPYGVVFPIRDICYTVQADTPILFREEDKKPLSVYRQGKPIILDHDTGDTCGQGPGCKGFKGGFSRSRDPYRPFRTGSQFKPQRIIPAFYTGHGIHPQGGSGYCIR
jgi:hypothetical protein